MGTHTKAGFFQIWEIIFSILKDVLVTSKLKNHECQKKMKKMLTKNSKSNWNPLQVFDNSLTDTEAANVNHIATFVALIVSWAEISQLAWIEIADMTKKKSWADVKLLQYKTFFFGSAIYNDIKDIKAWMKLKKITENKDWQAIT